jgi:hypothetical protein
VNPLIFAGCCMTAAIICALVIFGMAGVPFTTPYILIYGVGLVLAFGVTTVGIYRHPSVESEDG